MYVCICIQVCNYTHLNTNCISYESIINVHGFVVFTLVPKMFVLCTILCYVCLFVVVYMFVCCLQVPQCSCSEVLMGELCPKLCPCRGLIPTFDLESGHPLPSNRPRPLIRYLWSRLACSINRHTLGMMLCLKITGGTLHEEGGRTATRGPKY